MTRKQKRGLLAALAIGGIPWITSATCDPITGALDIFRDDEYYDPYYYDEVYVYDDCGVFWCF